MGHFPLGWALPLVIGILFDLIWAFLLVYGTIAVAAMPKTFVFLCKPLCTAEHALQIRA
jgi:hypothetical protein